MSHRSDDLDLRALSCVQAPSPHASPKAIARRDRERIADGMLPTPEERMRAIRQIVEEVARVPVTDDRTPDEILGYDESGLPA